MNLLLDKNENIINDLITHNFKKIYYLGIYCRYLKRKNNLKDEDLKLHYKKYLNKKNDNSELTLKITSLLKIGIESYNELII